MQLHVRRRFGLQEAYPDYNHVCMLSENQGQFLGTLISYFITAIKNGEKCIYLSNTNAIRTLRQKMQSMGMKTAILRNTGQLVFLDTNQLMEKGRFAHPERLVRVILNEADAAIDQGFRAIRFAQSISAQINGSSSATLLLEYESILTSHFFSRYPCTGLCLYNQSQLLPEALKCVLRSHPGVLIGDRVYENPYYLPPEDVLQGNRERNEVKRWLANIEALPGDYGWVSRSYIDNDEDNDKRYRAIVETQIDPICRFDSDGKLTYVNESFAHFFGRSRAELIGTSIYSLFTESEARLIERVIKELNSRNPVATVEHRIAGDSSVPRWQQWTIQALFKENGIPMDYQAVGRDVTQRKYYEAQLRYLAMHDSLTGLYNRVYFEEEMARVSSGRFDPVGLIICDVDGLKLVNDSRGHEAGDRLLLAASGILRESFREGDVIARVGGDEFAVLLLRTPEVAVEEACRRIREKVEQFNASGPEFPLSISLGYAVRNDSTIPMEQIFKAADNNMYGEKLVRNSSAKSAIVQTLMKALEARDFITEGHADRLQRLMSCVAQAMGMPEHSLNELILLAKFHDIGKVGLPDNILFKPGPLSEEEYKEMQKHCEIGHKIALAAPDLESIADGILKHHEWWNGEGYPLRLAGEEIPLHCRMLAIADAYDAITSDRPYRKARSREEAICELLRCAGTQFDPELVPRFVEIVITHSL